MSLESFLDRPTAHFASKARHIHAHQGTTFRRTIGDSRETFQKAQEGAL